MNGFDSHYGTYQIMRDTLHLTYAREELIPVNGAAPVSANLVLPRTLVIDGNSKRVLGLDGQQFCAAIGVAKF